MSDNRMYSFVMTYVVLTIVGSLCLANGLDSLISFYGVGIALLLFAAAIGIATVALHILGILTVNASKALHQWKQEMHTHRQRTLRNQSLDRASVAMETLEG